MSDNFKNEACKTYLEQTKLLVTLASAFIIAPIALFEKLQAMNSLIIIMELLFILSVFAGYVVFGSIAGSQHKGECDVYNIGTKIFSWVQIGFFFLGLILLLVNMAKMPKQVEFKESCKNVVTDIDSTSHFETAKIYFDFDRTELRPEAYEIINRVIQQLKRNKKRRVKIIANCDSIGTEKYNLKLSEKRAFIVKNYLISNDIESNRIQIEALGESIPITSNDTYNGRLLNRRTDFYLVTSD